MSLSRQSIYFIRSLALSIGNLIRHRDTPHQHAIHDNAKEANYILASV